MKRTVMLEFPDNWLKGKCNVCPLFKDGCCVVGLNEGGWCKLKVLPSKEAIYDSGYDDGYKDGRKDGADAVFSRYEDVR